MLWEKLRQDKGDKQGQGRDRRKGDATVDSGVNEDLSAPEENRALRCLGEGFPPRGNGKYKGPEAGTCLCEEQQESWPGCGR